MAADDALAFGICVTWEQAASVCAHLPSDGVCTRRGECRLTSCTFDSHGKVPADATTISEHSPPVRAVTCLCQHEEAYSFFVRGGLTADGSPFFDGKAKITATQHSERKRAGTTGAQSMHDKKALRK